jgi:hypothetical protein
MEKIRANSKFNPNPQIDNPVGLRGWLYFCCFIFANLGLIGVWFLVGSVFVQLDKFTMIHGIFSFHTAICICVFIILLFSFFAFWFLFHSKYGRRILIRLVNFLDSVLIEPFFSPKFFFPASTKINFLITPELFRNYIPSVPDFPPRPHLA